MRFAPGPACDEQPVSAVAQREDAPAVHRASTAPVVPLAARIAERRGDLRRPQAAPPAPWSSASLVERREDNSAIYF